MKWAGRNFQMVRAVTALLEHCIATLFQIPRTEYWLLSTGYFIYTFTRER